MPTIEVPISDLQTDPDFQFDPIFQKLVTQELQGLISVGLTRIDTAQVVSGSVIDGIIHSNLKLDALPQIKFMIRSGHRPAICLYWNDRIKSFVCPDEELILKAYQSLGIRHVPARILKPAHMSLEHGCVWIACKSDLVSLTREVPPKVSRCQGFSAPSDFASQVSKLIELTESSIDEITGFERTNNEQVHFHRVLRAILVRHVRAIDSLARMIALNRFEHALAINRMIYEGFLNFYLDWLAPEFIGPRFQLLSLFRNDRSNRGSSSDLVLRPLGGFENLMENTKRKARLTPLGETYHEHVYADLSLYAHQTYELIEREAHSDDEGAHGISDGELVGLGNQLNAITYEILSIVQNEIGNPISHSSMALEEQSGDN